MTLSPATVADMPPPQELTAVRFRQLTRWTDLLLPIWFLGWTLVRLVQIGWNGSFWDLSFIGGDFNIYRSAALAILDGGDPWSTSIVWSGMTFHFAAPPLAAQLFIPFALMSAPIALVTCYGLALGLATAGLRRLGLPLWWLLFPPMTEGLFAMNPQILLFGLLLIGGGPPARWGTRRTGTLLTGLSRSVAFAAKIYAIAPIIARREWQAVAACLGLLALSIAVAPGLWATYMSEFGVISQRIVAESHGGVSAALLLQPSVFADVLPGPEMLRLAAGLAIFGLVAGLGLIVALRDVRSAGWIVAPLLWPAAEYHIGTLAIPVARRPAIWIIAIPTVPTFLLGMIVLAYQIAADHGPIPSTPPPDPLRNWWNPVRRRPVG